MRPKLLFILTMLVLLAANCAGKGADINGAISSSASIRLLPTSPVQSSKMDEFVGQLDTMLPDLLRLYRVPGAALALVQDGEVVWTQGYGLADEERGTPITGETLFQVASISKSVTAWGVMRLVDENKIDLDAPVERYLMRWHLPQSEFDPGGVTPRRLLGHTAGIASWDYQGTRVDEMSPTLVELLSGAASDDAVRVDHQPGERENYSNGGYLLLQLLIEDVTGESFGEYMQRQVLTPLGMEHSTYQWSPEMLSSMAIGYEVSGRPMEYRHYPEAAGGLNSTAVDIAKWMAAGMAGPNSLSAGQGVLQPRTIAEMYTPVLVTKSSGNGLGYGIETLSNGLRMASHSGEFPGWRGQFTSLPDQGKGIVVLTNSNAGSRYVISDTICTWIEWAAGEVPKACQTYQALYVAIPVIAGLAGLGVVGSIWRTAAQISSGRRKPAWPPKSERQRRDILLSIIALAAWWLLVVPRLGLQLPPTFVWITLVYTIWCLAVIAKGLTTTTYCFDPE